MLSCIKESFNITNKYIILATPLIIFSLLSSLYLLFSANGNLISLLVALILFVLMLAAFLSGWFYMIKLAVSGEDREDANLLIKEFPAGVGEYFVPTLGLLFNTFVLSGVLLALTYIVGMKFIGNIGISPEAMSAALESVEKMKVFVYSLTDAQRVKILAWNLLLFLSVGLEYFLIMFYPPALVFKQKNPFKAFFAALKDLFSRKFLQNVLLYILIFIAYSILSILTTFSGLNIVTHFVFTLINFYYMVYVAVLICQYYYKNFVKIGGNLDETV